MKLRVGKSALSVLLALSTMVCVCLGLVCGNRGFEAHDVTIDNKSPFDLSRVVLRPHSTDRPAVETSVYHIGKGSVVRTRLAVMAENSYDVVCEFSNGRTKTAMIGYLTTSGTDNLEIVVTESSVDVNAEPKSFRDYLGW